MTLRIQDVAVALDGRPILKGVNITVPEGAVAGILGPNGSGKTTLLRTVYRVLRPTEGAVTIDGRDVWRTSARDVARLVGAVCQDHSLTYDLTVAELVRLGRFPHQGLFDGDPRRDAKVVSESIARVGMASLAGRRLSELSGGERQRALLAKALAQEPRLLILDEPTNHLDLRYQVEVLALVRRLALSAVITLHDLNLAAAYCDTLHLIAEGSVFASGTPDEVLIPATLERVFGVQVARGANPLTGRPHLFVCPV